MSSVIVPERADQDLVRVLAAGGEAESALREKLVVVAARCPLYSRQLVQHRHPPAGSEGNIQQCPSEGNIPESPSICDEIVVKQFNLLAEGLSAPPSAPTPFRAEEASCYGGFDSVENSDEVFDFHGYRKWRLLEEILRPGTVPDIITIQECDHFGDFFQPALRACGYDGVFAPKKHSPSLRFGFYSDGVAIFWRRELFELLPSASSNEATTEGPPVAYMIVSLQHIPTGSIIRVATCHLKAKHGVEMEAIRMAQITKILKYITPEDEATATILMGDFNTTPTEHCTAEPASTTVIDHVSKWRGGYLSSAYPFDTAESQAYSTWKSRGGSETKRLIDYIWYSAQHFKVLWTQDVPDAAEIHASVGKLPDMRYPSDHCALAAKLKILRPSSHSNL